jgi:N-terminal domain of toast_rack, DUF2154
MAVKCVVLAGVAACLASCNFTSTPTGPVTHESRSVDLDQTELARVGLKMSAGTLKVKGGSSKLMDADFAYNVASWKPEVRYNNTGARGDLTIEQPVSGGHFGEITYIWELRLNDQVALDLSATLGAGEANLNLGSMSLRSLEIEMGAGELNLDLRGQPKRSYDVRIRGGVGEATVHLPKDAGIEADVLGGIGDISARGLRKEQDRYVNDALNTSKVRIHLNIRGGVGSITLIAE